MRFVGMSDMIPSPCLPHTLPQVLIVEDDTDLSAFLVDQVQLGGRWSATAVTTLAAARDALRSGPLDAPPFDAMILDVVLPDGDGRALCAALRAEGLVLPIIILSGRAEEEDVVQGLDSGADAYVRKPFQAAELTARLNALLG